MVEGAGGGAPDPDKQLQIVKGSRRRGVPLAPVQLPVLRRSPRRKRSPSVIEVFVVFGFVGGFFDV